MATPGPAWMPDHLEVKVPLSELAGHTAQLLANLQTAFERPDRNATEQDRFMLALRRVSEFLDAIGAPMHYGTRFGELAFAIGDLEQGSVAPLLRPTSFGRGRAPDSSARWMGRAWVAVAMQALIQGGAGHKQAARKIIQLEPEVTRLARVNREGRAWEPLLYWESAFRNHKVNNQGAARLYAHLMAEMAKRMDAETRRCLVAAAVQNAVQTLST